MTERAADHAARRSGRARRDRRGRRLRARVPAFTLVGEQNRLAEDVAAVNPNTIAVLDTSQPVDLPWIDDPATDPRRP